MLVKWAPDLYSCFHILEMDWIIRVCGRAAPYNALSGKERCRHFDEIPHWSHLFLIFFLIVGLLTIWLLSQKNTNFYFVSNYASWIRHPCASRPTNWPGCCNVHSWDFLREHSFISMDQSAYLKRHSTQTSLHRGIDVLLENVNDGTIFPNVLIPPNIQFCWRNYKVWYH